MNPWNPPVGIVNVTSHYYRPPAGQRIGAAALNLATNQAELFLVPDDASEISANGWWRR